MNETFKSIAKADSSHWKWRRRDGEMSKQFGLGRRASFAMLRKAGVDVHRPADLDSDEFGLGRV